MDTTSAEIIEGLDDESRSKLSILKSIIHHQETLIHEKKAAALREAEASVRQRADNQRALREEIAKYESYIRQYQEKLPETQEQTKRLEQQVEEHRTQYENSQAKKRSIQQTRDRLAATVERKKTDKKVQTSKARKKLEKAELLAYKEALQLKIIGLGDFKNKFEFRCIDEKYPEKKYSFVLRLSADGIFSVTACDPPIRDLDRLEAQLRQEMDPYLFIKRMRNIFSEHAEATDSGSDTLYE